LSIHGNKIEYPIVIYNYSCHYSYCFTQISIESNNNGQTIGQMLLSTIYAAGGGKQEQISGQNHQQYLPVVENNLVPVQNTKDIALPFVSTTNQATKNL
jgi:hypothetical protein